jgi:hypothetical protein
VGEKQPMQLDQASEGDSWSADCHAVAGNRVQHPCRQHHDHAGRRLDMDDLTCSPLFAMLTAEPLPIERMPAIVNHDLLPDMGRMTPQLPSAAKLGCSVAPIAAVSALPSSIP